VLHDLTWKVGTDGGGPLMRTGSEAGAVAPTCMRRAAAGRAGPAGVAAAARGDNRNAWIGVAAACSRAGKSYMHVLWGLPKQSGRQRYGAGVHSVGRMYPEKRHLRRFLSHAEGARQKSGRTVGAGVTTGC
jgi:hypothetical protein